MCPSVMLLPVTVRGTTSRMATQATTLTECPMGHERWVTYQAGTPEREWVLICPLCGEEKKIVLPEILKADPS